MFKNIGEVCGEKLLRYFLVFVISKIFGKNEKFFGHLTKCCFFSPVVFSVVSFRSICSTSETF